jgi:hypothetical protein
MDFCYEMVLKKRWLLGKMSKIYILLQQLFEMLG